MNFGADAAGQDAGKATRGARQAESQLSLPLDADARNEDALRAAWARSGLSIPYHVALRNRPLAICLNCLADAMKKRTGAKRYGMQAARGAKRGRK